MEWISIRSFRFAQARNASGLVIAIGEMGLFLTAIDASAQNIDQPSARIVSGEIAVEDGTFEFDAEFEFNASDPIEIRNTSSSGPRPVECS
jgi:hypothetical protein